MTRIHTCEGFMVHMAGRCTKGFGKPRVSLHCVQAWAVVMANAGMLFGSI